MSKSIFSVASIIHLQLYIWHLFVGEERQQRRKSIFIPILTHFKTPVKRPSYFRRNRKISQKRIGISGQTIRDIKANISA